MSVTTPNAIQTRCPDVGTPEAVCRLATATGADVMGTGAPVGLWGLLLSGALHSLGSPTRTLSLDGAQVRRDVCAPVHVEWCDDEQPRCARLEHETRPAVERIASLETADRQIATLIAARRTTS